MNNKSKRYIKIESICDDPKCTQIHKQEGRGGMFAVLGEPLPQGGYKSQVGFFALHDQNEILNLMLSMMVAVFKNAPEAMLDAMGHSMKTSGVAEAVMERNMKARLQQKPTKLEGIN